MPGSPGWRATRTASWPRCRSASRWPGSSRRRSAQFALAVGPPARQVRDRARPLDDGPYETVAGFVISRLGRLGAVGDAVEVPGHRLTVTAVEDRWIRQVTLSALAGPHGEVPDGER
ncbi:hypothetical protein FFI11_002740 [Oerskovia sp. KBS0722]|nr:transporter associated domain-containing protein [Oerskovia sp. KBS0722]QDW61580.1 hypothetical protein FFI11_002740 [Oerskovia sp. KBS0722]